MGRDTFRLVVCFISLLSDSCLNALRVYNVWCYVRLFTWLFICLLLFTYFTLSRPSLENISKNGNWSHCKWKASLSWQRMPDIGMQALVNNLNYNKY